MSEEINVIKNEKEASKKEAEDRYKSLSSQIDQMEKERLSQKAIFINFTFALCNSRRIVIVFKSARIVGIR